MDEMVRRLLTEQNECVLGWVKRDGAPAATVMSFVLLGDRIALTALEGSARVQAIRRHPQVVLAVTGKGSPVGHGRCVSIQGECEVRGDRAARDRFFPAFSHAVLPGSERGAARTAENLVLLVTPRKVIPYDAQAALEAAARS